LAVLLAMKALRSGPRNSQLGSSSASASAPRRFSQAEASSAAVSRRRMFASRRRNHPTRVSPLGAVARGVTASAFGTLAMDSVWYRLYKREGGELGFRAWELSAGLDSWEDAPAPAQVGKRLVEALLQRELSPQYARLLNNVTHWGYGLLAGAGYGIVVGSLRSPKVWYGLPFGAGVWAAGYVVLPFTGTYRPIWEYDLETLAKDLSAHLVFGVGTAAAFRAPATEVDTW
jgi:hypothetical protein